MSEIKVNKISPRSGTTLTLGDSGDDFIIPAGATLTNNGTASGFASIAWQSTIVTTSTLTAVAGNGYWIDTTSNACTVTLPGSASVGDQIIFVDYARTWGTNKIIIDSNGLNYQGDPDTSTVEYNTNGQTVNIVYSGATKGWIPVSDDDVTDAPIVPPYDIDFLVIAGGGSGGSGRGGGGGAGGYRTSTQTGITVGTVITVTVGDGGALVNSTLGNNGSNSSISGSGLTTITSAGGGGGGTNIPVSSGSSGGSGGGGASPNSGGSGNSPSTSPSQGNNGGTGGPGVPNYTGGGGGGADAVGGNGTSTVAGNGGNGTASSITGSSVTRAGGGGGSVFEGGTGGSGGTGGGGAGVVDDVGVDGTANTGGGGGGGANALVGGYLNSGAGGKGVVILSMPDASYSGTTTGSPTVATGVSGKTVLTFTGSGSYTA
jgi:hypothetical protein